MVIASVVISGYSIFRKYSGVRDEKPTRAVAARIKKRPFAFRSRRETAGSGSESESGWAIGPVYLACAGRNAR